MFVDPDIHLFKHFYSTSHLSNLLSTITTLTSSLLPPPSHYWDPFRFPILHILLAHLSLTHFSLHMLRVNQVSGA